MLKALCLLDPAWQRRVYPESFDRELAPWATFVAPPQSKDTIRDNPGLLREVDVIFSGWGVPTLDAAFLAYAPRLRAVFHAAGSVRYFMTPEAWVRPLVVSSAYKLNAVPVAEYTLAAILFGLRGGWHQAARLRQHRNFWYCSDVPGSHGTTVALISFGAVARLVREYLRPFEVRVIVFDPFLTAAEAAQSAVTRVSLERAFQTADVVSVHTPLLPETHHLVRGIHLSSLKPGSTFINTARGAVVCEPEMIETLTKRADVHAVLDVTDPEPPAPDSPLHDLPNVTLTPHLAGTGYGEGPRLGRAMLDEFHRWRQGQPLLHAVTEAQAARLA